MIPTLQDRISTVSVAECSNLLTDLGFILIFERRLIELYFGILVDEILT